MNLYFRLNPQLNKKHEVTMFEMADLLGAHLIQGNRWGDDYLVVKEGTEAAACVEEMMTEAGWFFERVETLPTEHYWQLRSYE